MILKTIREIGLIFIFSGIVTCFMIFSPLEISSAIAASSPLAVMEETTEEATNTAQEKVTEAQEAVEKGIEDATQKAKETKENVENKVKEGVEKTKQATEEATNKAKENSENMIEKAKSIFTGE